MATSFVFPSAATATATAAVTTAPKMVSKIFNQLFEDVYFDIQDIIGGQKVILEANTFRELNVFLSQAFSNFNVTDCNIFENKVLSNGSNGVVYRGIGKVGGIEQKLAIKIESPDLAPDEIYKMVTALMAYGRTDDYISTHGYSLAEVEVVDNSGSTTVIYVLVTIMDMGITSFSDYLKRPHCNTQADLLEFERTSLSMTGTAGNKYEFQKIRFYLTQKFITDYFDKLSSMIDVSEGYDFKPGNALVIDKGSTYDPDDLGIVIIDIDEQYCGYLKDYVMNPSVQPKGIKCDIEIFKIMIMYLNYIFVFDYFVSKNMIDFFGDTDKFIRFVFLQYALDRNDYINRLIFTESDILISSIDYCINNHDSGMIYAMQHYFRNCASYVFNDRTNTIPPILMRKHLNYLRCWSMIAKMFIGKLIDISDAASFLNDPNTRAEFNRLTRLYPHL